MKIAVLLATGYEEGESLFLADILMRGGFTCDLVSTTGEQMVSGCHGITVRADRLLDENMQEYDMVILPGGMPGAANLRDNPAVVSLVQEFDAAGKYIGAICAAPMVLHQAGIDKGRTLTSYPGEKYTSLFTESDYREEIVVVDKNLITSRGPATTLPFAYAIIDLLGGNSAKLKESMLYNMVRESGI